MSREIEQPSEAELGFSLATLARIGCGGSSNKCEWRPPCTITGGTLPAVSKVLPVD